MSQLTEKLPAPLAAGTAAPGHREPGGPTHRADTGRAGGTGITDTPGGHRESRGDRNHRHTMRTGRAGGPETPTRNPVVPKTRSSEIEKGETPGVEQILVSRSGTKRRSDWKRISLARGDLVIPEAVRRPLRSLETLFPSFPRDSAAMAGVKDKDAFQRINFLYQAAHCVLSQNPVNETLARFYCHTQRTICKRLVLRQDPSVKRTICKRCSSLLVPGVTAKVRQRRRSQRLTVVSCLTCGLTKRFPNKPGYSLWVDRPEAQVQPKAQSQPQTGKILRASGARIAEWAQDDAEKPAGKK